MSTGQDKSKNISTNSEKPLPKKELTRQEKSKKIAKAFAPILLARLQKKGILPKKEPSDSETTLTQTNKPQHDIMNNPTIEDDPKDVASYYYNRGNDYAKLGNHKQAIEDFKKAIELNPKEGDFYRKRGASYFVLGNHNQAIKDYDKAIELDPKNASFYYSRGLVHFILGNYKKVIADFDKVIEFNAQDAATYYSRGIAYRKLGDDKHSIEDVKKSAKLGFKGAQDLLTKKGITW